MSAHTDNAIEIEAPLGLVWSMANDVESWPWLFADEYSAVEVLEREAGRVVFRLTTVPQEDGRTYSWVSERVLDEANRCVEARRLEPGPFRYLRIFQSFDAMPGGVRLRWVQDFEVRPGAPFSDQEMAARINRTSASQLLRHKRLMEEAAVRQTG